MSAEEIIKEKQSLMKKLQEAVELELSTIPPYLTALYSIKPGTNTAAYNAIKGVALEEMLHMVLAANTLSAIGGSVKLGKKNLRKYPYTLKFRKSKMTDRDVVINLRKFDPQSLELFLEIEKPIDKVHQMGMRTIEGITVGDFYEGILRDLDHLSSRMSQRELFSGNQKHQISEKYYWGAGGKPIIVTDHKTAKAAIHEIMEQGEGMTDPQSNERPLDHSENIPHYFRFKELKMERSYAVTDLRKGDPTGASIHVDYTSVYPIGDNLKHKDYKKKPDLEYLNARFNYNYAMMLSQLQEGFAGNTDAFYSAIVNCMRNMTTLAKDLVKQELAPGIHAAPSFEWPDSFPLDPSA